MLYNAIKRLIARGATEGLREHIDVLYAAASLTTDQYTELVDQLNAAA